MHDAFTGPATSDTDLIERLVRPSHEHNVSHGLGAAILQRDAQLKVGPESHELRLHAQVLARSVGDGALAVREHLDVGTGGPDLRRDGIGGRVLYCMRKLQRTEAAAQ